MASRTDQLMRLERFLLDGLNVSLQGAPRVGKSWVADKVAHALSVGRTLVLSVDLSSHPSGAEVFAWLHQQLDAHGGHAGIDEAPLGIHECWRALRGCLEARQSLAIIVLDEFDAVVHWDDAHDFLRLLREMIHRPVRSCCAALIVSRRTVDALEADVAGISTLSSVCVYEYAGAVDTDDVRRLWPSASDLSTEELDDCLIWSAGYPQLVEYWLSARPDGIHGEAAGLQQVRVFERLVDHLERVRLADAAAQLVIGPTVDDWFKEVKELRVLGVLDHERGLGPFGRHAAFVEVLRRRARSLAPWGVLGFAEVKLRGLVDDRLTAVHGMDWVDALVLVDEEVAGIVLEVFSRPVTPDRESLQWLARAVPADLAALIDVRWEDFADVFDAESREHWTRVLATFAAYRPAVREGPAAVLSEASRRLCQDAATWIIDVVDGGPGQKVLALPAES